MRGRFEIGARNCFGEREKGKRPLRTCCVAAAPLQPLECPSKHVTASPPPSFCGGRILVPGRVEPTIRPSIRYEFRRQQRHLPMHRNKKHSVVRRMGKLYGRKTLNEVRCTEPLAHLPANETLSHVRDISRHHLKPRLSMFKTRMMHPRYMNFLRSCDDALAV